MIVLSANQFIRFTIATGKNVWTGDNLGHEDMPGIEAFGIGDFGGRSHFRNRTSYKYRR